MQTIKNLTRNLLRKTMLGKTLAGLLGGEKYEKIKFVSATRMTEREFWKNSPLGQSVHHWLKDANVSISVHYENSTGLPEIYNAYLGRDEPADILVFLHDDVWLNDSSLLAKIRLGLKQFDIIGVAGNRRRQAKQPAWLFSHIENTKFVWDSNYLSGAVAHGRPGNAKTQTYGPMPSSCELLDGVFLAVARKRVADSSVKFDPRFTFDFYDMDFCRSARRSRLCLGTFPINIIHESSGIFGKPSWAEAYNKYLKKWKK